MDEIGSIKMDLDSDIDLESGGTTREKDAKKGQALSDEKSKISSKIMSSESSYAGDSSPSSVDEIHFKSKEEKFRVGMGNYVDKKRVKKPSAARPPRPHRHPKDISLSPYDVKLLKEMYELNLSRKKMGRMRTFNKMKRHKGPSLKSNLWAFIVTIIFFAVIILQGNNNISQ